MIDEDVLISLKKIAQVQKQKYQTLINHILRAYLENSNKKVSSLTEERVRRIVREELRKRA